MRWRLRGQGGCRAGKEGWYSKNANRTMHGRIQNEIVKPVVSGPSMQSLDVLLQLLQLEIASPRRRLSSMKSLTTFVPGADRPANARSGGGWGLLRRRGTDVALE